MAKSSPRKVLVANSIGGFGEVYDFAIFAFSVPILAMHFFPSQDQASGVLSAFTVYAIAFFGRPLGGIMFGYLADRIGRMKVLTFTIFLMATGTATIGLLPTYEQIGVAAPILLFVCRLFQGMAMGGESTGSVSYVLESAPTGSRGRWVGTIYMFTFLPNAFTAMLLLLLQTMLTQEVYQDWGWRMPFLAGGLIGILGFWLRKNLQESDEFENAKRDAPARHNSFAAAATSSGLRSMVCVFLLLPAVTVSSYMLIGYMYTFLVKVVMLPSQTALFSNAAALLVLSLMLPVSGALSDRFGRRPLMATGAVWIMLLGYPAMYLVGNGGVAGAFGGQIMLAIGIALYSGAALTAMPELFPTSFRGTGHAISYQTGVAVFGGSTPLIAAWLVKLSGSPVAPGIYIAVVAAISLLVIRWVPETSHVGLRDSVGGVHAPNGHTPVERPGQASREVPQP
jgi:MHS family proline/betaine transporter-like MFS transporter